MPESDLSEESIDFLNNIGSKKELHQLASRITPGHIGLVISADPEGIVSMIPFGNLTPEVLRSILELTYEVVTTSQ